MSKKLCEGLLAALGEAQTSKFNPLYFHGQREPLLSALNAAEKAYRAAHPHGRIVRLNAEKLASAVIDVALKNDAELRALRRGDMLIFEDAQALSVYKIAQWDFFSLFDFYYERGLPILIGASAAPAHLPPMEDRVFTLLCGCTICPID